MLGFLAFGLVLISCSKEGGISGNEINIEVGPKMTAFFGETGMSSNYPFPVSGFLEDGTTMLVFNRFNNSIDTLYFEGDQISVKAGNYLQSDGPRKVENFVNMCLTSKGMVYISQKTLVFDNEGSGEIENLRLVNFDQFKSDFSYNIALGVSYSMDHFFKGYDSKNDKFYFFVDQIEGSDIGLYEFDLVNIKTKEIPPLYNTELIEANKAIYNVGKGSISLNNMPYIFYQEQKLIISYQYSNEITVIDLVSNKHENFTSEPLLFPKSKKPFIPISSELDYLEVLDKLNEWSFDITYGNLEKLPNNKGFCRLIRGATLGEDKNNPEIFIEVFDNELNKVGEANLTEIQPDLSTFFFAVGQRLFFKAKEQPNENYLNYYFIEIDF